MHIFGKVAHCTINVSRNIWIRLYSSFAILVQLLSCGRLFATPWTAACQASLSFSISWSLLKPMFIESMMPSKYLILCHPLLLLPSVFPRIRVFFNELALHVMRPKYWSFSFSISPSNEYLGLISFRTDWFDLLVSKGRSNLHLLHLLHCRRLLDTLSHPLSGNKPSSDLRRTLGAWDGGGGGDGESKQRKRNETQGGASGGARMMSRPQSGGRPCRERSGHAAPAGSGRTHQSPPFFLGQDT